MITNPYDVLGVPFNASNDVIKSAFRSLAKATHPDLNGNNHSLTERFRSIAEAYAILSDPVKKHTYDSIFKQAGSEQTQKSYSSKYYDEIRAAAVELELYIHLLNEQVKPYKKAAVQSLGIGIAWFIGGVFVSGGSYIAALNNGGGTYVVAWGAILFGGIQAVKSLYNYSKINGLVAEAEAEMWSALNL